MTRILHVTQCFAGGVKRAIEARVAAASEHEHHLLFSGTEDIERETPWASVLRLPTGHMKAVAAVMAAVGLVRPDVVHAHSSWAGFYSRVPVLPAPVVYEPHCLKFDDPSLTPLKAWVFRTAEWALARRTTAFGTLSTHEARLVRSIAPGAATVRLENTASIDSAPDRPSAVRPRGSVVMIGRLAPQKDPDFFLRAAREIRRRDAALRVVWVGDGEAHYRRMLEAEGVEVTGWVGRQEVRERLLDAVYMHTAAYEGLPLTLLEAAAADAPIVARAIPSICDLPIQLESTPEGLAEAACRLARPGPRQSAALRGNVRIRHLHTPERLRESLVRFYGIAA